jgi:hypothetical protein
LAQARAGSRVHGGVAEGLRGRGPAARSAPAGPPSQTGFTSAYLLKCSKPG